MGRDATYDAFISYNHAADGALASALRRDLQRFAKKWYARRAMRVFLDRDSLEATASLGDALDDKLRGARYLIMLASRESAGSPWCDHEARFWLRERGPDSLLLVLTDAESDVRWDWDANRFDPEASTAIPPALVDGYPEQPLWTDLRWVERDGAARTLDLRNPQYRRSIAQLAATIRGTDLDQLDSEDLLQHRRATRIRTGAIVVLAALTVLVGVFFLQARSERDRAQREAAAAIAQQASSLAADDPGTALVLAAEAVTRRDDPRTSLALIGVGVDRGALATVMRGHAAQINSVAVSDVGGFVVTGSTDRSARIWDLRTGELRSTLEVGAIVNGVAADSTGSTVFTADASGRLLAWDAASGAPRTSQLEGASLSTAYEDVAVSPAGDLVAAANRDGTARVWSTSTGGSIATLEHGGGSLGVHRVAFDSSGTRLATLGYADNTVMVWDLATTTSVQVAAAGAGTNRYDLAFSPDGEHLATAEFDGSIRIWNLGADELVGTLAGHSGIVWAIAYDDDGSQLASAGFDGTVRLWDVQSAKGLPGKIDGQLAVLHHESEVRGVVVVPDRGVVVSAGVDLTARVWDTTCLQLVDGTQPSSHLDAAGGVVMVGGFGRVLRWDLATGPLGAGCDVLVAGSETVFESGDADGANEAAPGLDDSSAADQLADDLADLDLGPSDFEGFDLDRLRELSTGTAVLSPGATPAMLGDLALSDDGSLLAAAVGSRVELHDLGTGTSSILVQLAEAAGSVASVDLGPGRNGTAAVVGAGSGSVIGFADAGDGAPTWRVEIDAAVLAVRMSADGRLVAVVTSVGDDDIEVSVRDAATGEPVAVPVEVPRPPANAPVELAFAVDRLAVTSRLSTVLLEASSGWEQPVELSGAFSDVEDLVFDPVDDLLVALERLGRVTVWDVAGRRPLVAFESSFDGDPASAIAVLGDDGRLVTLSETGRLRLWPPLVRTVDDACRLAQSLTTFGNVASALAGVEPSVCPDLPGSPPRD